MPRSTIRTSTRSSVWRAEGAFVLGFPVYFKIELTLAKILGVLALVIPAVPFKVKEFAYLGFAITLVSASIAVDGVVFLFRKEPFARRGRGVIEP